LYINSQPHGQSPLEDEYLKTAHLRADVLETIKEWLDKGAGAQDILDDGQLYDALQTFLSNSADHIVHRPSTFRDDNVNEAWSNLDELRKSLLLVMSSQAKSPSARVTPPAKSFVSPRPQSFGGHLPDIDNIDAEELLDNLDAIAGAALGSVTEEVRVGHSDSSFWQLNASCCRTSLQPSIY
jgi:GTPase-activating protein BEM2